MWTVVVVIFYECYYDYVPMLLFSISSITHTQAQTHKHKAFFHSSTRSLVPLIHLRVPEQKFLLVFKTSLLLSFSPIFHVLCFSLLVDDQEQCAIAIIVSNNREEIVCFFFYFFFFSTLIIIIMCMCIEIVCCMLHALRCFAVCG